MEAEREKNEDPTLMSLCPNVAMSLGLFASPTQFGMWKRSLSWFFRKYDLRRGGSHMERWRLTIEEGDRHRDR